MGRHSPSMWRMAKQDYPLKENLSPQMSMGSSSQCPATGQTSAKEAGMKSLCVQEPNEVAVNLQTMNKHLLWMM